MTPGSAPCGSWGCRSPATGTRWPTWCGGSSADAVLIAIPSAGADLVRALTEQARPLNVDVKVVPPVVELFGRTVRIEDIRPVSHADLLGRREIDIDLAAVAGYLTGRRVLVTGAGGSIGSELCRQVARFHPAQLVMLDRDESGLHAVQLSLEGRALLDDRNLVVADIRDQQRLDEVFAEHRPQVVFHAAALKHLPLLEMHPSEALKTNVIGTYQMLQTALRHGVDRFVNISTDKAADPTSVLGYSKRIAERLTAAADESATGTYCSVRFGNVLGSRGSVLTAFAAQVEAGGPITVTDPEVTRYFMTVAGGGAAGHPGRRHRQRRRGAGARHGRAGPDRRRRPPAGRRGRAAHRDRLHRTAARGEAARGPVRRRRGRPAAQPPADLPGAGAAAGRRGAVPARPDRAPQGPDRRAALAGREPGPVRAAAQRQRAGPVGRAQERHGRHS